MSEICSSVGLLIGKGHIPASANQRRDSILTSSFISQGGTTGLARISRSSANCSSSARSILRVNLLLALTASLSMQNSAVSRARHKNLLRPSCLSTGIWTRLSDAAYFGPIYARVVVEASTLHLNRYPRVVRGSIAPRHSAFRHSGYAAKEHENRSSRGLRQKPRLSKQKPFSCQSWFHRRCFMLHRRWLYWRFGLPVTPLGCLIRTPRTLQAEAKSWLT